MKFKYKDIARTILDERLSYAFSLEMRSKHDALVGGVCGVEISSPENICLSLIGGGSITLAGRSLCCTSYGNHFADIEGVIESIQLGAVKV